MGGLRLEEEKDVGALGGVYVTRACLHENYILVGVHKGIVNKWRSPVAACYKITNKGRPTHFPEERGEARTWNITLIYFCILNKHFEISIEAHSFSCISSQKIVFRCRTSQLLPRNSIQLKR